MKTLGILLIPGVTLLSGCAGTMSNPLPPYETVVAKCKALEGPSEAGVKPPKLVEKGKEVRGLIFGSGGYACVRATVTAEGKLTEPEVLVTNNKSYADAFVKSLAGYVYEPARKDGAPVLSKVVLTGWWSDAGLPMSTSGETVTAKPGQGP
ncbi:MAG TPA: hypothetical protein VLH41_04980 [Thermoanaerobaculia bacterium]|nr:hypothetical protein [Thermoanaerobaculia bacterium]